MERRNQEQLFYDEKEKQKNEIYKCNYTIDDLRNKLENLNIKYKEASKKIEENNEKIKRMKEKSNDNQNVIYILEKNDLEKKLDTITKDANDKINKLNSMVEIFNQEKENFVSEIQLLYIKNEEYKLKYEELTQNYNEIFERNKKLEKISKNMNNKDNNFNSNQNNEEVALDMIYGTEVVNNVKTEERKKTEEFTVQMEVNIARINKNQNKLMSINPTNIVNIPSNNTCEIKEIDFQHKVKSEVESKSKSNNIIAKLLQDQDNIAHFEHDNYQSILSENDNNNNTSENMQSENSFFENEEQHQTNGSNVVYSSNNYDTLRQYQPKYEKYESEDNYNSIKGDYSSSLSNIKK